MTAVVEHERRTGGRAKAAWFLVLVTPLIAEGAFSGVWKPAVWLGLPLLVPMYGAGVLLVRELGCRARAGWPGLLLLGLAYELVEDGIALQALTSPHLYSAAGWGPRVLGFNTTYWESQLGYHLVFSVVVPIVIIDLVFPDHARKPLLRTGGLIGTVVAFVVGVVAVRVLISGTEDPGYQTPWPVLIGLLAAIAALVVVTLTVLPRLRPVQVPRVGRVPHPAVLAALAGVASVVFLALIFPLGRQPGQPAVGDGYWVLIPMAIALGLAGVVGWLVARWSVSPGFAHTHRIGLVGGALVGHTASAIVSGIVAGTAVLSMIIGGAVIILTVTSLMFLLRRVERRTTAEENPRN